MTIGASHSGILGFFKGGSAYTPYVDGALANVFCISKSSIPLL